MLSCRSKIPSFEYLIVLFCKLKICRIFSLGQVILFINNIVLLFFYQHYCKDKHSEMEPQGCANLSEEEEGVEQGDRYTVF